MISIPMTRAQFAEKAEQLQQEQGIEITGDRAALQVESLDGNFFMRAEARIKSWLGG